MAKTARALRWQQGEPHDLDDGRSSSRPSPTSLDALPVAARLLDLQRTAGNHAVTSMLVVQRKFVKIGTEEVQVSDKAAVAAKETQEAKAIITRLKTAYGLDLDSGRLVKAIKEAHPNAPQAVKDMLGAATWRMDDLRALSEALAHFSPILGANRAQSNRGSEAQEVVAAGKAMASIDKNLPTGELDPDALGRYFDSQKSLGMFGGAEDIEGDFGDKKKDLVGLFVHEAAHGLLSYALGDFMKATGYWAGYHQKYADTFDADKTKPGEVPPTPYGDSNLGEDLSETAKFFFVDPKRLKNGNGSAKAGEIGGPCPRRYAFMEQLGKDWMPTLKKATKARAKAKT